MSAPARSGELMEAATLARSRREAMRARTRRIRRSVAGLAVTLFVVVFAIVLVQLASGHDPALLAARRRAALGSSRASSRPPAPATSSSSTGTESSAEGAESTGSGASSGQGEFAGGSSAAESGVSGVRTSQS